MSVDVHQQNQPGAVAAVRVDWAPVPKVNLLPQEILEARAFRRVQRRLVGGVVVTLLVAAAGVGWSVYEVAAAQEELDASRARTTQLHAEEARYADVPRVLAQVQQAQDARERALGRDVLWYRFFDELAAATPGAVSLSNVAVSVDTTVTAGAGTAGAAGAAGAPAAAGPVSSDPLVPPGIGTVTFEGGSDRFPDVAEWLESVATITGLDGSSLQSATRDTEAGGVSFSSKIVVDETALSHRFDGKAL